MLRAGTCHSEEFPAGDKIVPAGHQLSQQEQGRSAQPTDPRGSQISSHANAGEVI